MTQLFTVPTEDPCESGWAFVLTQDNELFKIERTYLTLKHPHTNNYWVWVDNKAIALQYSLDSAKFNFSIQEDQTLVEALSQHEEIQAALAVLKKYNVLDLK